MGTIRAKAPYIKGAFFMPESTKESTQRADTCSQMLALAPPCQRWRQGVQVLACSPSVRPCETAWLSAYCSPMLFACNPPRQILRRGVCALNRKGSLSGAPSTRPWWLAQERPPPIFFPPLALPPFLFPPPVPPATLGLAACSPSVAWAWFGIIPSEGGQELGGGQVLRPSGVRREKAFLVFSLLVSLARHFVPTFVGHCRGCFLPSSGLQKTPPSPPGQAMPLPHTRIHNKKRHEMCRFSLC